MTRRWSYVCASALFNFYNRWIDATGVQDIQMSGHRLATEGYAQPEEKSAAAGGGRRS